MILQNVNVLITTFALMGISINILYNFFSSIFYGKKSVQNPWNSNTLEWTAPVEHIHGNWPGDSQVYITYPNYEEDLFRKMFQ
jgi:cytochrome c oxidase subunit 1